MIDINSKDPVLMKIRPDARSDKFPDAKNTAFEQLR
jgi:hypothetical protein